MFGVFGAVLLVAFCVLAELVLYSYGGILLALLPLWLGIFIIVAIVLAVRRQSRLRLVVDNTREVK